MSLIDGVGDEVVHFLGVLVMVTIGMAAWWSTNARQDRFRAVVLMRSRNHHPVTVSIRTRSTGGHVNSQTSQAVSTDSTDAPTAPSLIESNRNDSTPVPLQEMDSIVDAEVAMIDHHRLHFYRRVEPSPPQISSSESTGDESEPQEESEPASQNQIQEMDNIVSAMEADGSAGRPFGNNESNSKSTQEVTINSVVESQESSNNQPNNEESNILIKLKYLNDTLKEVEGNLDELLKDFKCRHFSTELSSQRRVRLIFQGRVLDEQKTLRALGLHHQAIVHCLVHPIRNNQRAIPEEPTLNAAPTNTNREGAQPERTWDLENVLMTLVSVALTVVWFFRCEYSNMFTASASVALFGLTVFYSVAIFGLYLSDTFHFDRRPQQPVPNN